MIMNWFILQHTKTLKISFIENENHLDIKKMKENITIHKKQ